MNGYSYLSATYRKAAEQGKVSQDYAEKQCKAFDFLETCDDEDIYNLFDSGAFNSIAKSFVHCTVSQLIKDGTLNEKQAEAVRAQFSELFEGFHGGAKDIHERY